MKTREELEKEVDYLKTILKSVDETLYELREQLDRIYKK